MTDWCGSPDDTRGDCVPTAVANVFQAVLGIEVDPSEIAVAHERAIGCFDGAYDHGQDITATLADLVANGWAADPRLQPSEFHIVPLDALRGALVEYRAAIVWLALPVLDGDYDWVGTETPGTVSHAVCVVPGTLETVLVVSWGREYTVTDAWLTAYCKGVWVMRFPEGLT